MNQLSKMNNLIHLTNNNQSIIFVYLMYDNCLLQIAQIEPKGSDLKRIPAGSIVLAKQGDYMNDILVPKDTIAVKTVSEENYLIF